MKVSFFIISLLILVLSPLVSVSQSTGGQMSYQTYAELKASGSLPDMTNIEVVYPDPVTKKGKGEPIEMFKTPSYCFGYLPPGPGATSGFLQDDQSLNVTINFPFCFYGQTYTSVYINDNGNITFDFPYAEFSSSGFPGFTPSMIAPFWADFHQGIFGGNGLIWYESLPTALIVHYDNVGYFFEGADKRNTMMLIITDENDPLLSPGNNVGFFYEDMQWTTGSDPVSGGVNGFGGVPATVGINKGDGVAFIQLGRFDQPGIAYDGAFGNSDGVDWLDNKSFMFNVCSSTNVPPIIADIDLCDTLRVCMDDTLLFDFSIISGELGQITEIVVDSSQISNYTVVSNTLGNTAVLNSYVVGETVGWDTLSFMAFDDGSPADTISFQLFVFTDTIAFSPSVTGGIIACLGETVSLNATTGFDSYVWSSSLVDTISVLDNVLVGPGEYTVTATIGACSETTPVHIVDQFPRYIPLIGGDTIICVTGIPSDDTTTLFIDTTLNSILTYSSVLWSPGGETTADVLVGVGAYTVTVTDTNGCVETSDMVNVLDFAGIVITPGFATFCEGDSALLDAGPGFDSYLWNGVPGDNLQTYYALQQGNDTVIVTEGICENYIPFTVTMISELIPIISGDSFYCFGSDTVLTESSGSAFSSYEWLLGGVTVAGEVNQTITASQGGYQVVGNYGVCSDTSTVFILTELAFTPSGLQFEEFVCIGGSIEVTASSGFISYSWSNGDITNPITLYQGGSYTLDYVDANGCPEDTTIVVSTENVPIIVGDATACDGSYQFSMNSAPAGVTWTYVGPGILNFQNSTNDLNPLITTTTNGVYTLTMTDDKCLQPIDHVIEFEGYPQKVLLDKEVCENDNYLFDPEQEVTVVSYDWNTGSSSSTLLAEITGWYTVVITGLCGAPVTDSAYLDVVNCKIPNVITPNGDGQNDSFILLIAEKYDDVHLLIYDRWGLAVYESTSYDNTWEGQKKDTNQKVTAGTYYYVLIWDEGSQNATGVVTVFDSK